MDNKALYKLSYGVFLVATKAGDKVNGCITNTAIQVAGDPTRLALACINTNYTCELIKESGLLTVSVLDQSVTFDLIKHFGMQSGRNVDKFASFRMPSDENGIPYLGWAANAMFSAKVVEQHDLGSHTLFIAEITDAKVLSDKAPLTYADYQDHVKPKPQAKSEEKKVVAWKCRICGYVYEGANLPEGFTCPVCGHDSDDFEPVYEK